MKLNISSVDTKTYETENLCSDQHDGRRVRFAAVGMPPRSDTDAAVYRSCVLVCCWVSRLCFVRLSAPSGSYVPSVLTPHAHLLHAGLAFSKTFAPYSARLRLATLNTPLCDALACTPNGTEALLFAILPLRAVVCELRWRRRVASSYLRCALPSSNQSVAMLRRSGAWSMA